MISSVKYLTSTKLPTYLREFITDDCLINLILNRNTQEPLNETAQIKRKSSSISQLDLTGSPLKIELNVDDELDWTIVSGSFPNWTLEESKHVPITLKEARTCLRNYTLQKDQTICDINPLFCVCDGSDDKHIVCLGVAKHNHVTTFSVSILGLYLPTHECTTIGYMKAEHLRNVRQKSEIEISKTNTYSIYGSNLKNCSNLNNVENNGSVTIEISSDKCISESFETYSDIRVNLQVILGHRSSSVCDFWKELEFLHKLIETLSNVSQAELEYYSICDDPLSAAEISDEINICFNEATPEKTDRKSLDLKNLRDTSILDSLWNILKRCKDVSDLRDCFHILFEELVEVQTKIQVPTTNDSLIAQIISGILKGTLAVPTVTLSQSIEFLLELGIEYLKNEYLAIINYFCDNFHDSFLRKWEKAGPEEAPGAGQAFKRRTRVTAISKSAVSDLRSIHLRHLYLTRMHALVEFLFLSKEYCDLPDEKYEDLCAALYNYYLLNSDEGETFVEFQNKKLCEFSWNLNQIDPNFLKSKSPSKQRMRLSSVTDSAEIVTMFLLSEYPIFPESIFKDYEETSLSSTQPGWYVSKFVQYTEKFSDSY